MIAGVKHPISDLPFVADRVPDEVNPKGRHFWSVNPTGDYVADCRTGNRYALAFLDISAPHASNAKGCLSCP